MGFRALKKRVRGIGVRLGWLTDYAAPIGQERDPSWYDKAFAETKGYHCLYPQSCYYFMWAVIADRVRRAGIQSVLEIGCGPGQLAVLLMEQGVTHYTGLDFSPGAVEMARSNSPFGTFIIGDARECDVYDTTEFDAVISTEVLEHVEEDLTVVSRFPSGKRCICSVPNFPGESHVRHFETESDVIARYGKYFDGLDVMTLRGTRQPEERFFLFDGVRNSSAGSVLT